MELDKSLIGMRGDIYTVDVEKRHIGQFAEAIGDPNPLYTNEKYAANSPYEGIIAPPTFLVSLGGGGGLPLDVDYRRMLHGEQEFIYHRPIRLGDRLQGQMVVADIYEREGKSGTMQFLVLDTEFTDESGELVAVSRNNIIYRPLPAK